MRKFTAGFAIVIAFAALMTPVAMANVRAFHLCCPPQTESKTTQAGAMDHCDGMVSGTTVALRSDMSDCSRHMVSTAAPGVVHPAGQVVIGQPKAAHPILDEFAPILANETNRSSQKDRAPPANGR